MGTNLHALTAAIEYCDTRLEHVLEFGVYRGRTIKYLRKNLNRTVKVFGFDSFTGLPEDWERASIKKETFDVNGKIPKIPGVMFFRGWFCDTIPQYKMIARPIKLLHVDCDLYSSTRDVLYGLTNFIVKNTIIIFDEWYYNHDHNYDDEEQRAFWEWVADTSTAFMFLDFVGRDDPKNEKKIVSIL